MGAATASVNATSVGVVVPGSVQVGDALLLFAAQGNVASLTGPGSGWSQVGRAVDGVHAATLWRRTATAADAGSTVRLSTGSTLTKVALTVAAYRHVDGADPVVSSAGAPEPGTVAAHRTPTVGNGVGGAWRVSFWSDRNSATTRWAAPAGEVVRAQSIGSGGVGNTVDGAWRVSFWSDRNSATTRWSAPAGESVRAQVIGSGGGRVTRC